MLNGQFQIGEWVVEPQLNSIIGHDKTIRVEPKVMRVLVCLAEHAGEVLAKERLIKLVWDTTYVTDDVLTRCISELRKIFEDDAKAPRYIQTIPRSGYRLIAPVSNNGVAQDVDLNKDGKTASIPQHRPQKWEMRSVWAGALLVLVASSAIWLFISRRSSDPPLPPMRVLPFTSFPDGAGAPAFSPDGNQIAFIWGGEKGDNNDIYTQLVDGGKSLRLTSNPAADIFPTWSPDGRRIAFVRFSGNKAEIFTVSPLGGEERKLITLDENPEWGYVTNLSWSPDGKFIAYSDHKSSEEPASIYLLSVESLEKQRLTYPPEQYWGDIYAEFSPDGKSLSINRFSNQVAGDLYIVPVAGGEAQRLTFDNASITGAAWTEEGRELIFASNRKGSIPSLWRISATGGSPERLSITGENAAGVSISRQGHHLAYGQCYNPNSNIYRIDLKKPTDQNNSSTCLSCSTRHDYNPHISPDGKRIAFQSDRTGGFEVWICNSDGSEQRQVTFSGGPNVGSPRWSPDGRQIAFDSVLKGNSDIYVMDAEGGKPRQLTDEKSDEDAPTWSSDGHWIYFTSNRTGGWQVWKIPAEGGKAVQVTKRGGGFKASESPDGKFIYYTQFNGAGIYRVPVEGGEETLVIDSYKAGWGNWAVVDDGIYFIKQDSSGEATIKFFNFATQQVLDVVALGKVNLWLLALAVSPDRQWLLYTRVDQGNTGNITLVENFR